MKLNECPRGQRLHTTAQRTPAVAPQKQLWWSQAQFFNSLDRPNSTRTEGSTLHTEDTLKPSIAASPSLFRAWPFRAPSARPRDPERYSFLACAGKNKRDWRQRARDDACRRSRLLSSVFVGRELCDMLRRESDLIKK